MQQGQFFFLPEGIPSLILPLRFCAASEVLEEIYLDHMAGMVSLLITMILSWTKSSGSQAHRSYELGISLWQRVVLGWVEAEGWLTNKRNFPRVSAE